MNDVDDMLMGCFGVLLTLVVLFFLGWGVLSAVDNLYFERRAFATITACEAKRMEARRKALSSQVICVPAYRATKSDTLRLEGVK